jgi:hypothetical protein
MYQDGAVSSRMNFMQIFTLMFVVEWAAQTQPANKPVGLLKEIEEETRDKLDCLSERRIDSTLKPWCHAECCPKNIDPY